jgi:hypothetical protein
MTFSQPWQWYDFSDPAMEHALIEVPTMRRFAGIDMISDRIPDETTILAFRHLLEKNDLAKLPGVNYVGGPAYLIVAGQPNRSLRWSKPTSRTTEWP